MLLLQSSERQRNRGGSVRTWSPPTGKANALLLRASTGGLYLFHDLSLLTLELAHLGWIEIAPNLFGREEAGGEQLL